MAENTKTPTIRFAGFTEAWEQRKLGELFNFHYGDGNNNPSNGGQYPVFGAGGIQGGYTKYNAENSVIIGHMGDAGCVSWGEGKHFVTYNGTITKPKDDVFSAKFGYYLLLNMNLRKYRGGSGLPFLTYDMLTEMETKCSNSKMETQKIADYFHHLDNLITLHQRKYEKFSNVKKSMLEKMFPKNGSNVPEIRFKGFTEAWKQRKFSDLVQIERGGSPRPIDNFITDSPDGLNWVKIGDAPAQGNRIIKTAEKIRPEGLSKTREVHPGDLILSNSMSFGKPYIMGIYGCIHDGWLLIRDTNSIFDLTFLCHLLGTPQMLDKYRSLAAGSTVNNLNKELVGNTFVTIPKIDEQRVLGQYLEHLDHLITLHQRKLEKLQNIKKSMLEKMFI